MRACDTCIHVRVRARKHTQGIQVGDEVSLHALKSEQYNGLNGIVMRGLSFEGVYAGGCLCDYVRVCICDCMYARGRAQFACVNLRKREPGIRRLLSLRLVRRE